jgi:hypothetical protein
MLDTALYHTFVRLIQYLGESSSLLYDSDPNQVFLRYGPFCASITDRLSGLVELPQNTIAVISMNRYHLPIGEYLSTKY